MTSPSTTPTRHAGLLLIALYEFAKGVVLLLVAIGLLRMLNRDLQQMVMHWAHVLRLDLHQRFIAGLAQKAGLINPHQLKQYSAFFFFTGGVHVVQGTGLYFGKRWAEYLTVLATSAFIPLEVIEVVRHVGPVRCTILLLNVTLVVYLIVLLWRRRKEPSRLPPPSVVSLQS